MVNIHAPKEGMLSPQNALKLNKMGVNKKYGCSLIRIGCFLKAKGFGIRDTSTIKDEGPIMIIAICHKEMGP